MPITIDISGPVLEPETLHNMSTAFEAACDKLCLIRDAPQTELVAKFVIKLAQTGVHDFESLLAATLHRFAPNEYWSLSIPLVPV